MPFDEWAFVQRRQAALDGAWKVEVSERVMHDRTIRSVTSWHSDAKQLSTPLALRFVQQSFGDAFDHQRGAAKTLHRTPECQRPGAVGQSRADGTQPEDREPQQDRQLAPGPVGQRAVEQLPRRQAGSARPPVRGVRFRAADADLGASEVAKHNNLAS